MEKQPSNSGESFWRRKLSDAERAGLRTQPELAIEAQLTDALAKIPDAPVASNFTTRVMEMIELEEKQADRAHGWHWSWRVLLPRFAVTAAILLFAGIGLHRYETNSQRAALVKNVALVTASEPLPSVEALNNFDAIQRMSQRADDQLLALMQ